MEFMVNFIRLFVVGIYLTSPLLIFFIFLMVKW